MSRVHEALARAAAEAGRSERDALNVRQGGSGADFRSPWEFEAGEETLAVPEAPPETVAGPRSVPSLEQLLERDPGRRAPGAAPRRRPEASLPPLAAGPSAAGLDSQLAQQWPQPVAAEVTDKLVVTPGMPAGARSEYEKLAAALEAARQESTRVIAVAGVRPGDGTTLTATNLALSLSGSSGRRVLLVDGCTRHRGIHRLFQVSAGRPGLTGLAGAIELTSRLVLLPQRRSAGSAVAVEGEEARTLVTGARASFDWILIDGGAIGADAQASAVLELADRVVLVAVPGSTPSSELTRCVDLVPRDRLAGVLLNRVPGVVAERRTRR